MTDLRQLARGRECQVRLPGICNHDPATTILAHYRLSGLNGMGMKPPDVIAAYSCSSCNDVCDRRTYTNLSRDYVRLALAEGVMRTLVILVREDKLTW